MSDEAQLTGVAAALTPLGRDAPRIDRPTRSATVPVVGAAADVLPTAVQRVAEAGIDPDDIGLRRPTLDEVFLALTGEHIDDEETDAVEAA